MKRPHSLVSGFAHVLVLILVAGLVGVLGISLSQLAHQPRNIQPIEQSVLSAKSDSEIETENEEIDSPSDDSLSNHNKENRLELGDKKPVDESFNASQSANTERMISPAQVINASNEKDTQTKISDVQLVPDKNKIGENVFRVVGVKTGLIFGLIPVTSAFEKDVDSLTGEVIRVQEPAWWKLISPFLK